MTGRGRELADMMERRNVDILCLQETKWKGSKARNIGGGCKIFYNGADGRKNDIEIVLREELAKSVLEVQKCTTLSSTLTQYTIFGNATIIRISKAKTTKSAQSTNSYYFYPHFQNPTENTVALYNRKHFNHF